MKIMITAFNDRVSPRFDCAPSARIIELEDGRIDHIENISTHGWSVSSRIEWIVSNDIDTVVCGAIDRQSAMLLQNHGVTVVGWVTGMIDDALSCQLSGNLEPRTMLGKGGCRRGRWRFRRGRQF